MPRRAFTLIELLVVVAIIGLLSTVAVISTNASRAAARDVKRKADLLQISRAVELYIDTNGVPPGGFVGWCTYIKNPSWPQVATGLAPYLSTIPSDPTKPNQVGDYFFKNSDNLSKYILCANLEQATGQSWNFGGGCTASGVYNYCIMPNGQ